MTTFCLEVDPGICGFLCTIKAESKDKRIARIYISGSGCTMIQELARLLNEVSFRDIFVPLTSNPIFLGAEKAGCHLACPVPVAVVKAAEATMVLALPKNVSMHFA